MKNNEIERAYDLLDSKLSYELSDEEKEFVENTFEQGVNSFDMMKASAAMAKKSMQMESYGIEVDLKMLASIKSTANKSGLLLNPNHFYNSLIVRSLAASFAIFIGLTFFFSSKESNFISQNVKLLAADTSILHKKIESAYANPSDGITPPVETEYKPVKFKRNFDKDFLPNKRNMDRIKDGSLKFNMQKNTKPVNPEDSLVMRLAPIENSLT